VIVQFQFLVSADSRSSTRLDLLFISKTPFITGERERGRERERDLQVQTAVQVLHYCCCAHQLVFL
jgi:hypothetical protein